MNWLLDYHFHSLYNCHGSAITSLLLDRSRSYSSDRKMVDEAFKSANRNPLEQFLLLAKNAKGAAAGHLIRQVTEAPGVYVFGELMKLPQIAEVCKVQAIFL